MLQDCLLSDFRGICTMQTILSAVGMVIIKDEVVLVTEV